MTTALYRRILGPAFEQMPPSLQTFHDITRPKVFTASFNITRADGWLRNLACRFGGLPAAGEDVPMRLRVVPDGDAEIWDREFGSQRLRSIQQFRDGLMVETVGAIRFGFRLLVEGKSLRLKLEKAWFLGVRCPLWLAPGGSGIETGEADGCGVVVRATAPLLGQLVQYEGIVLTPTTS